MLIELTNENRTDRKPWAWTPVNEARAADVLNVFNEFREWWPLTERAGYYRLLSSTLVSSPTWKVYGKSENERVDLYAVLSPLLKHMRLDGRLPWEALVDSTRVLTSKRGFGSLDRFIDSELRGFLQGYNRCLAGDQSNYIEIWIEKQALLSIVEPVADEYCRRVMCCKGYNSITFQADFCNRAEEAKARGQKPIVLYFGDWDPSGVNMLLTAIQTLQEDFGLTGVEYRRCGINPEHFAALPADPVPIKPTDKRSQAFVEEHGKTCYELDAFHPSDLENLVRKSIERFTDMKAIACNYTQESADLELLRRLKTDVVKFVNYRRTVEKI